MPTRNLRILMAAAITTIGAAAFWSTSARSQINASPSWIPIGVSSSGTTSTAWFHEPSSRQALACQTETTPGSGITGVKCVVARLP
ncbi:MAG: hypothetical protein ABT20_18565 [Rubrivivax sp. SCN 70-15]|nr:MAG: hypothetical protein ABT20_18565 [Rubrivivax sp. SCN 70-15]